MSIVLAGAAGSSAPLEPSYSAKEVVLSNPDDTDESPNEFFANDKNKVKQRFR